MDDDKSRVLIAGGGSVGMSLAAELAYRGIPSVLVEERVEVNEHPRANAIANRTMEYYRRWGFDKNIIGLGISPDLPNDYQFVSSLHGRLVYKIALPSHNQLMDMVKAEGANDARFNQSPYLKNIMGQNELDAALKEHVLGQPGLIDARFGSALVGFRQDKNGVVAYIKNSVDGDVEEVKADYMVACDGGRSLVRSTLDIDLEGEAGLGRFVAIHFKAPGLNREFGHANIYFPLNKVDSGFVMNWDGGTTYTYHYILDEGEQPDDIDPVARVKAMAGWDVPVEIHSVQPWTAHALVAKSYRCGRVFLAGDSAHLFTPTGGFGMNTGVSDAIDIAWKLQAMIEGWGGHRLLDTYHEERHPIGVRNTNISGNYFHILKFIYRFGDVLDEDSPEGDMARDQIRAELDSQVKGLIDSSGCLLGYRYEDSSICVQDGSSAPPDHPQLYWPTTRPGHRMPHVWVDEGVALYDLFDRDFNLVRTDKTIEVTSFMMAAREADLPIKLVDVPTHCAAEVLDNSLILVRPDLMVTWRGNLAPDNPQEIIDRIRGA